MRPRPASQETGHVDETANDPSGVRGREKEIKMKFRGPALTLALALTAVAVSAGSALAHHPMGGATPTTFMEGFLSGVGHPIIGLDHLAFVLAVGIAAAFMPGRFVTPLAFAGATIVGCALMLMGAVLPLAEIVITASVVLVGGLLLSGRTLPVAAMVAIFAGAGLFHGFAYAEAIVGAETTPLVAYLGAFALTQYAIAIAAGALVLNVWKATDVRAIQPRLAGAALAGVGFAFLFENVEGMIF